MGDIFFGLFPLITLVFLVFFVAVVFFMVIAITKRWSAAKQEGLDPMTADVQLMGQVRRSALLAEDRPVEDRLAELDRLLQNGFISPDEHAQQRARILGQI